MRVATADRRQTDRGGGTLGSAITAALRPDHAGVEALDRVEVPAVVLKASGIPTLRQARGEPRGGTPERVYAAVVWVWRDRQPALGVDGGDRFGGGPLRWQKGIDEQRQQMAI